MNALGPVEPGTAVGHVKYMSERPGSHGLFDADGAANLEAAMDEIKCSKSIVWRDVVSLHEDDAARLGYTTREAWEDALRRSVPDVASAMGIREGNLRWVAAFHQKAGHPHCHISFWEQTPERTRGVVSKGERRDMRKAFMNIIYENERARLYLEKNTIRDLLRDQTVQELGGLGLRRFLKEINLEAEAEAGGRPGLVPVLDEVRGEFQVKLEEIAQMLPDHGRIALRYMLPEVKEKVQETADWLLRQPGFSEQVGRYQEIAGGLASTYTKNEKSHDQARQNAYNDVRERVSQVLLKGTAEVQRAGRAERGVEPERERIDYVGDGTGAGGGGFGVDRRSVKLAESLYRYTWRAVDGEVYSLDPGQRQQLVMPDKSDQKIAGMTVGLERLAEILPVDIKSRPTLAYLPEEVKAEAREFAGRILDAGGYHSRLAELSPETAQQLKERVAEQALSLAAGLRPRKIEITMIAHEDRAAKAIECCRAARSDFIGDDKEETAWTVEALYRSLTRLGAVEDQARQCAIEWARGTEVDTNAVIDKYETKMAIRAKRDERDGDQPKEPPVISRRDWTRLTQNLCLQDEQLLYPWYGVMQPEQQSEAEKDAKVDLPHHLEEDRIQGAVQVLQVAQGKPADRVELEWTVRAYAATLHALGVGEAERAEAICNWTKAAGVEIPKTRLRDISDRLSLPVNYRGDYWLGQKGWDRLTQNLGIQAENPWVVEHTRSGASVVRGVWNEAFRVVERERQKAEARGKMAKMKESRKQEIKQHQYQQGYYQDQVDGYER